MLPMLPSLRFRVGSFATPIPSSMTLTPVPSPTTVTVPPVILAVSPERGTFGLPPGLPQFAATFIRPVEPFQYRVDMVIVSFN